MERNDYFILIACEESQRVTKAFHDSILAPHFAKEMALQWGMFLEQNEQYNRRLETRGVKWN